VLEGAAAAAASGFACRFVKAAIEQLEAAGIAAGSVDVIISNCVINLSAAAAAAAAVLGVTQVCQGSN
jgi:hypothetical protein